MSDDLDQVLEAGSLLVIKRGAYSDLSPERPVWMLKSVTKRQLADEFIAYVSYWYPHCDHDESDFLPWLVKTGYVEAIDNVNVWHIGAYGFDPYGH